MYAYVKFLSDPLKDKKKVVSTSCIQNFKKDTHTKIIKYLVTQGENAFPATVLLLADSKKEMDEMIAKKRTCSAPSHLLQSAPEDVNSDNGRNNLKLSKSSLITQDNSKLENLLTKKLKKYNSETNILLTENHTEVSDTQVSLEVKNNENTQSLTNVCEKNIETAKSRNAHQTYESEGSSEVECTSEEDEQVEENLLLCTKSSSAPRKIQKLLRDESNQAGNTKVHKSVTLNKSNAKPVVKMISKVHPVTECKADFNKLNSKYVTLKEENCKVKEKMKELKEENEKLRNNRSYLKKKLEEKTCEIRKVRELNENLQVTIIEKFQERDAMVEKLLHARESILYEDNYPPIGTLRTSDNCRRIHIGRDQWIHEAGYSTLLNTAKSPCQCASSILTLVFDLEVLLISTISGFESNKKQLGKKACPKLDPVKFGACEDFYIYWMKNTYKPKKDEKKNYLSELNKFDYYAGKKIADLKRNRESSSKKSSKRSNKTKQLSKSDEDLNNEKFQMDNKTQASTNPAKNNENLEEDLRVNKKTAESTAGCSRELDNKNQENIKTIDVFYDWSPNTSISISDKEEVNPLGDV